VNASVDAKKGTPNKATAEIKALAQEYGAEAIETLANALRSSDPKVAIMAANALLDRGYGKPAQTIAGDPEKPLEHNVGVVDAFTRRISEMASKVRA
jgi:hypothetical protein